MAAERITDDPAEAAPPPDGDRAWFRDPNHHPGVINAIRRARQALPGDPNFGDPLSVAGFGGPEAAARAAGRLLGERRAASRELSLAGLQVWQALAEKVTRKPVNDEVTLVFTDLVGFSTWALQAGDDATLRLLRQVAQVVEPPMLDAGGRVVKRLGDGIMAVFDDPVTAVRAVRTGRAALREIEVDGYTPRMRVGIHTGRPQKIGSDWLGVDVNIAARLMQSAGKGHMVVSGATLERIADDLDELGVTARRLRRPLFAPRLPGVPADIELYRLESRRDGRASSS
ncbi:adenylate/guanylate cyclase domain-containing protein [Mycobacterium sp. MYCO198283]|uniref:adenylate/guanylate cyclase domain-containing protein n=1 Tax=Mycobacterium sp. MYCO198283 TaxID=2883505 RepID=UPI0035ABA130